jgi:6-phosphogluconolactonase/glucosamine-6-phosphate isomerase/deaminase
MNVNLYHSAAELYQEAAQIILNTIKSRGERFNFVPIGGQSVLPIYQHLIPHLSLPEYQHVHYYIPQEIPLKGMPVGAIQQHLDIYLFKPANIPEERIHALTAENYNQADYALAENGGIDLCLLTLSKKGHIAGNKPGTSFQSLTHQVPVDRRDELEMQYLKEEVGLEELIPDHTYSFGIKTLMQSQNVLLFVVGEDKARILRMVLHGPLSETIPASVLHLHPNCRIMFDQEASIKLGY